jgi:hypothetical protein
MFNPNFNPAQVMLGGGSQTNPAWGNKPPITQGPYMPTKPMPTKAQPFSGLAGPSRGTPAQPGGTLGSEAVRATGAGPYDNAYRQDLATYAGGQFQRPGGSLSFNPTGPLFGNPTGGGNAPVQGMPNDLLSLALGGQGFGAQPTPPVAPKPKPPMQFNWQDWVQNMGGNFGNRRLTS